MLCDAMKWSHLPEPGGLYQQNPDLIDHFYYLFAERAKAREAEQKRQEAESKRNSGKGMTSTPRGRGRK